MFRFQHSDYLFALAIVPLFVVLFLLLLLWRRNRLRRLGGQDLVRSQLLGFIPGRITLKFLLLSLSLIALIFGWANLQAGDHAEKVERKGIDVIIALDVSKSMLAKDIQPDRLTRSKQMILSMLDKMQNNRVGLVVFAGHAYLQVPLTVDYNSVRMLLQGVTPALIPTQGTVIGEAIDLSMKSFSQKERKFKSLIIISDGEDHDENAIAAARTAAESGVIIQTVGVGSPQGSTLTDPDTHAIKLDEHGQPVVTRLNEQALAQIAVAGKGNYFQLNNPVSTAEKLVGVTDDMEQRNLGVSMFTDYTSYFQYFLGVALALLLLEWFLPSAKKKFRTPVAAALLCCFMTPSASAQQANSLLREGNKFYQQGKYQDAAAVYQKAITKDPASSAGIFNLGNALYKEKKFDQSRATLNAAAQKAPDPQQQAAANYNVGNTYMAEKKWQEAADAFKNALRKNPQDADAKYNLSYAQQMLKKEQEQNKNNKNNKDDKKKEDQKKEDQKKKEDDKKDDQQKDQGQNKPDQKQQNEAEQQDAPTPGKLSQQQAEQILNALNRDEKNLQEKKQKAKGVPVKLDKDW